MPEYTREQLLKYTSFVDKTKKAGVAVKGGSPFDVDAVSEKRALLKIVHSGLVSLGGKHVLIDDCSPEQVTKAFERIYAVAEAFVKSFDHIIL